MKSIALIVTVGSVGGLIWYLESSVGSLFAVSILMLVLGVALVLVIQLVQLAATRSTLATAADFTGHQSRMAIEAMKAVRSDSTAAGQYARLEVEAFKRGAPSYSPQQKRLMMSPDDGWEAKPVYDDRPVGTFKVVE